MKQRLRACSSLILGLILTLPIWANTNADVFVYNLTGIDLHMYCQLANNTRFYAYPTQQTHAFTITQDSDAIDIYILDQPVVNGPNMRCYNQENLADYFSYQVVGDKEIVHVGGHFHYDHSYPGSITFESH
jgi:hypothetical protein